MTIESNFELNYEWENVLTSFFLCKTKYSNLF